MERSENITEISKALSKMQGALKSVPKDSTNPFFKARYASLDAIWDIVRKPLTDNSLCLVQTPKEDYKGKLSLETLLLHSSGEWIKAELPLNAKANDPQSIGSAITYARRYSLSAMLGISADEDDDAEAAQGRDKESPKPASKPAEKAATASPDSKHWCPVHKVNFFMKGNMKSFAHPIKDENGKDTGEWCHEHKPEPGQLKVEDMQTDREEPPPEDEPSEGQKPEDKKKDIPERDPETVKTFTLLYKACHEDFGMQPGNVFNKLGVKTQAELTMLPKDCYKKIVALMS